MVCKIQALIIFKIDGLIKKQARDNILLQQNQSNTQSIQIRCIFNLTARFPVLATLQKQYCAPWYYKLVFVIVLLHLLS